MAKARGAHMKSKRKARNAMARGQIAQIRQQLKQPLIPSQDEKTKE